jgi:hypothetical protein
VNSAELLQVNASYKFRVTCLEHLAECLKQLAKSLRVRPSPGMFDRVPRWLADSFPRDISRQREAVSVFNPWDYEALYPLADFNEVGDGSN